MTTQKKAKPVRYTSPKGTFRYPALVKPDYGTEEFPKPNGEFKVQLILNEADNQDFINKMQVLHDAAVEEGKKKFSELKVEQRKKLKELKVSDLFAVEYDKETEEPTGNVIFKFSTSASGKNQKGEEWKRTIPLFDAKGKKVSLPAVGGGTLGKVSFEASPYFVAGQGMAGVKFYLTAVQVLELRTYGGGNAEEYGFGEEEGFDGIESEAESNGFGDESGEGESSGDSSEAPNEDF
jgi:hypothetical protein